MERLEQVRQLAAAIIRETMAVDVAGAPERPTDLVDVKTGATAAMGTHKDVSLQMLAVQKLQAMLEELADTNLKLRAENQYLRQATFQTTEQAKKPKPKGMPT